MPPYPQSAFKADSPPRPFLGRSFIEPIPIRPSTDEMVLKIETLQRERDQFKLESELERNKNIELEKEFIVLRELISHQAKPIGHDENMVLRD